MLSIEPFACIFSQVYFAQMSFTQMSFSQMFFAQMSFSQISFAQMSFSQMSLCANVTQPLNLASLKHLIKSHLCVLLLDMYGWNLKFISRDLWMHFVVDPSWLNKILWYFISIDKILWYWQCLNEIKQD